EGRGGGGTDLDHRYVLRIAVTVTGCEAHRPVRVDAVVDRSCLAGGKRPPSQEGIAGKDPDVIRQAVFAETGHAAVGIAGIRMAGSDGGGHGCDDQPPRKEKAHKLLFYRKRRLKIGKDTHLPCSQLTAAARAASAPPSG